MHLEKLFFKHIGNKELSRVYIQIILERENTRIIRDACAMERNKYGRRIKKPIWGILTTFIMSRRKGKISPRGRLQKDAQVPGLLSLLQGVPDALSEVLNIA